MIGGIPTGKGLPVVVLILKAGKTHSNMALQNKWTEFIES